MANPTVTNLDVMMAYRVGRVGHHRLGQTGG